MKVFYIDLEDLFLDASHCFDCHVVENIFTLSFDLACDLLRIKHIYIVDVLCDCSEKQNVLFTDTCCYMFIDLQKEENFSFDLIRLQNLAAVLCLEYYIFEFV